MASADKPMKQNTLEGFTKKVESSPKVQRVQSGPIRYAGATNVRHSPISRPDGGGGSKGGARHQKVAAEQVPSSSTPVADNNPKTPTVTGGLKRLFYSEVQGDLFSCPDSASLVHCVSEDMHMGKGIATLFKQKFGGVKELKAQGVKTGGLAVLKRGDRFIYYLVTKACYFHKPTYRTLQASLEALCSHCVSNGVRELCMPCIGCGLDRLQWGRVSDMIQKVFADVDISITVYYFK